MHEIITQAIKVLQSIQNNQKTALVLFGFFAASSWIVWKFTHSQATKKYQTTWCDCGGRSPVANEVRYNGLMDISR